uniref:CCHC-type domain-containing protein n=1 Tax=Tanacetum cinerariifolium TaxID=118510 RepID=A0A699GSL9_TANCI|nr:hypothetical protein [Tanacetum cinerariifolium]
MIKELPPKTTEEIVARENERKSRTTLLMALPEDHLAKFHKMADAKEMWEAIKSIFGGNDESKKMHKFQTLLSQLEIHGVGVSHKDANQQFLRSLPSSWSQVALIMRTKPGLDTLSFDDLYNNLRVFERDVKGTTASSSSNTQNVASSSADNTSNTNDVSTSYSVSSPSVSKSQKEGYASYTDEINDDDLEEMDLKWKVAMISMRIKKFHKRTGRNLQFDTRDTIGFDNTKVECFNCHKIRHFTRDCRGKRNQDSRRRDGGYNRNKARDNGRRPTYQDDSKAFVTIDGEAVDWSRHVEEDTQNFAMMAYSSSNSSFDNESVVMNKECDLENTLVNDRYVEGMHTVPPPMIGNYMPSGPDVEIDYSKFTYGPKQTSVDESDSKLVEDASSDSDSTVSETKVWTDAPVIEEYESYSDDDLVFILQENIEKPSFAFINSVKHVKSPRENIKETGTPNHYPKIKKQDRHSHTRNGLGSAFTIKSCFVCGSFSHLIRDCDFHEKRMAKQAALTKIKKKGAGQQAHRPDDPHKALKDKGIIDSGCFRHMTGNKAHLADYQEFKGGYVAFGGSNRRITGKFDGKSDSGFLVGYSLNSKGFRVYNLGTKRVEENLHVNFLENKPNVIGKGHAWMFDLDYLINSMNYEPVSLENQANKFAGLKEANHNACTEANDDQDGNLEEIDLHNEHFVLPIWSAYSTTIKSSQDKIQKTTNCKTSKKPVSQVKQIFQEELEKLKRQENEANDAARKEATHEIQDVNTNSTNLLNVVSVPVSVVGPSRALSDDEPSYPDDPLMPYLKDIYDSPSARIFTNLSYDDEGVVIDFNNLKTTVNLSPTPTTRIYTFHPKTQILRDPLLAVHTRSKVHKNFKAHALWNPKRSLKHWKMKVRLMLCKRNYCSSRFRSVKIASTPIETQKPLVKDEDDADVDVTPKTSHLQAVKMIFRYLKGQPKLGLWYPKASSFDLEAYSDSDYAGVNLDMKSTTGSFQFLGRRLISWQCKKHTIVATSTTEAEYVAAAH